MFDLREVFQECNSCFKRDLPVSAFRKFVKAPKNNRIFHVLFEGK